MAAHQSRFRVRFHDVDHAGIIFFARIQQYCHDALEDLQRAAGIPLEGFFEALGIAAPLVDVSARYLRPYRHGALMCIDTGIDHLGTTSIGTTFWCRDEAGALCARVRFVQCIIDLATFTPRPLPPELREALAPYRVEPDAA